MSKLVNKMYFKALAAKNTVLNALKNERGEANIISIILILVIVITLAIVFRDSLTSLFNKIWNSLFNKVDPLL